MFMPFGSEGFTQSEEVFSLAREGEFAAATALQLERGKGERKHSCATVLEKHFHSPCA